MEEHHTQTEAQPIHGIAPTVQREYVITSDLENQIQKFSKAPVSLRVPPRGDRVYTDFQNGLVKHIEASMPSASIHTISMDDLSDEILREAMRKKSLIKDAFIVSTCSEIATPRHGCVLEINRIYDAYGQFLGLGPRPDHSKIDGQISSIMNAANGAPIVLVEDGAFSGGTLKYVMEKLHRKCVKVAAVVVGFCFPAAHQLLNDCFANINFEGDFVTIEEIDTPIDWMPDHDFFPFAPNCGRIYGIKHGESEPVPYREPAANCSYLSFSFPYLQPFGDPENWATIPKHRVNSLSQFCLNSAIELFRQMETLNRKTLTISDIVGTCPRTSVPIDIGTPRFPGPETSVVQYLCGAREIIS